MLGYTARHQKRPQAVYKVPAGPKKHADQSVMARRNRGINADILYYIILYNIISILTIYTKLQQKITNDWKSKIAA